MEAMTVSQILEKMIAFSEGNIHDIDHLIRVWTYAKTIGELEGLDAGTHHAVFEPRRQDGRRRKTAEKRVLPVKRLKRRGLQTRVFLRP